MESKKEFGMETNGSYLYVRLPLLLFRLCLSRVSDCALELVHDFREYEYPEWMIKNKQNNYPEWMGFFIYDSKPHMFGGAIVYPVHISDDEDEYDYLEEKFCFDAYEVDPSNPEGPLVAVGAESPVRKFVGPKIRPTVVTIDGKTCVLTGPPLLSNVYELEGPYFEVFDHDRRTWERPEDPPSFGREGGKTILGYFAWGHRLLVRAIAGLSIFDARTLLWEDGLWFISQLWPLAAPIPIGTAAEIQGRFYLAMSSEKDTLGAYEFDPNGVIKSYRELYKISEVINGEPVLRLEFCTGFVAEVDDGRVCFVFGGGTVHDGCCVHVAIFQVSCMDGLSVELESLRLFDLQGYDPIYKVIDSIGIVSDCFEKRAAEYADSDAIIRQTMPEKEFEEMEIIPDKDVIIEEMTREKDAKIKKKESSRLYNKFARVMSAGNNLLK